MQNVNKELSGSAHSLKKSDRIKISNFCKYIKEEIYIYHSLCARRGGQGMLLALVLLFLFFIHFFL